MKSKPDLLQQIETLEGKTGILALASQLHKQNIAIQDLLEITLHPEHLFSFRAAWVLENVILHNVHLYAQDIVPILAYGKRIKNPSCQRHYAKIYGHFTSAKAAAEQLNQTDLDPMVEQCFDWLIDEQVLVAVKARAAEVLFNLRHRYNWIDDELPPLLEKLMYNGSPAILSTGRRLLGKLDSKRKLSRL
ncbi:hypothetical protein KHS38_05140 [Mucilaginibacter sp. Bleaf8]|uniref:hypothetical protein n=1 Tax=Mucilaginibacter sp. Bleaf8 TaxID=2834430 RepID=UPI001BCC7470|nr:hypothetical protein [Mucilaginibacter sp. Bleaf8]MBS7563781.1 hypothetical protein [Mucilaginibacter sp. Bleaf8]